MPTGELSGQSVDGGGHVERATTPRPIGMTLRPDGAARREKLSMGLPDRRLLTRLLYALIDEAADEVDDGDRGATVRTLQE